MTKDLPEVELNEPAPRKVTPKSNKHSLAQDIALGFVAGIAIYMLVYAFSNAVSAGWHDAIC